MRSNSVYAFKAKPGLSEDVIRELSAYKQEPIWMLERRLAAYQIFLKKSLPTWGGDLTKIDFESIHYYVRPEAKKASSWNDLPADIKKTYDYLGIPEAEKKYLSGVSAQYESEVLYKSIHTELSKLGVVFLDTDSGLQQYPELFKEYFGTLIPAGDNKFAALNTAFWSGGSFVYIPKGVIVPMPLQAYFRINTQNMGQFERTLIIAEEATSVHYIEGCSAPTYTTSSLHSAVVEIFVKEEAKVRYTTVQNWSPNVYNLVTKRARVEKQATMQWIDGNLGSQLTMKYPSCYLMGEGARGEVLSIAYAGAGQHQDAGAKMMHFAPYTSSRIVSKSIAKDAGRTSYRGLVYVKRGAHHTKTKVVCDALLLDAQSRSDTYPTMKIDEQHTQVEHEAVVSKIGDEQLFYLMSRGVTKERAEALIVNGFLDSVVRELPLEYAVELNRLIALEMEGSIG
ncbi:MAG: Fe-S cluster assembly protein SufB [Candidatus Roizmanbacteria bacterium]|nr:Fe-S cluster assembly protein SufB [Candidatus Roizmanbacteria bacterium]